MRASAMFVQFRTISAFSLLAAAVSTSAYAQSSSARILDAAQDGVTPPVPTTPLAIPDSEFPLIALTEAQEGSITLNLLVDIQGRVTFAQQLTSTGSDVLDQTAVQIARGRWTFEPARMNGEARVSSVEVEVNWKLPLRPADEFSAEMIGIPVSGKRVTQPKANTEINRAVRANYPIASVRRGEQGEVALRLEVLESGTVGQIELLDSSGFSRLDESAMNAAKRYAYEPGTVDGQLTRMWTYVMWQFSIGQRVVGRRPAGPPQPVTRTYCHSRPILTAPVLVTAEATNEQVNLRQWAHATADGTIDDVLILTTKGWMRFNQPLIENLSRVAALPPAARVNRASSCWYNASLAVRPMIEGSAEALLQRGIVNDKLDDADRAIEDFTKALAINPDLARAYNGRAVVYSDKGDYENALKDHEQALRITPNAPGYLMNRGTTYRRMGRFAESVDDFDKAIRNNPTLPSAFNGRCYVLANWGKAREAIADCNRALRLRPGDPNILDSRGYAYLRMGDYRAAIADYDEAIKAGARAGEPYFGRGVAKIRSGNADEGNADIAEAVKRDPEIAEKMAQLGVTL